ncbi:MAG: AAA+ family ATPase [Pseudomonadota bacterium]
MKRFGSIPYALLIGAAGLSATPAPAESPPPTLPELQKKLGDALRDLTDRLAPLFDDMTRGMGVIDQIDDFENYSAPEMMPNGDIIIKRRPDAPPFSRPEPPEIAPKDGIKT